MTLSFKWLTRLSQWRANRAVVAPGARELVQTKDVFKKNELWLTGSLVESLTFSSSLYPRVKRETRKAPLPVPLASSRISPIRCRLHRQMGTQVSPPLLAAAQLLSDGNV